MLRQNCRYIFPTFSVSSIGKYDNSFNVWFNDLLTILYTWSSEIILKDMKNENYVSIYRNDARPCEHDIYVLIGNFNALLYNFEKLSHTNLFQQPNLFILTVFEGTDLIIKSPDIDQRCRKTLNTCNIFPVSTYCKDILTKHGFFVKQIMPNFVGKDKYDLSFTPDFSSTEFIFICVSTNARRKNVQLLIDVFNSGFSDTNHVKLYLRVDGIDVNSFTPNIKSIPPQLSMSQLYKQGHCVILPSSVEGFGMPVLEGLLNGLPAVVPYHSGLVDFVNATNSLPVKYTVSKKPYVTRDSGIYGDIYDIDTDDLLKQMKKMVTQAHSLSKTIDRTHLYNTFANESSFVS